MMTTIEQKTTASPFFIENSNYSGLLNAKLKRIEAEEFAL